MSATTLWCAAAFVLTRRWLSSRRPADLFGAALSSALALGAHGASAFFLIAPIAAIAVPVRVHTVRIVMASCCVALVATALLYAYLPLRSSYVVAHRLDPTLQLGLGPGQPFWDWGDPRSVERFVSVVTGAPVAAGATVRHVTSIAALPAAARYGFASLQAALGRAMLLLVVVCCAIALVRKPRMSLMLVAPAVLITPFIAAFSAESDPERYYIFPLWSLFVCAMIGISEIVGRRRLRARGALLAAAVSLAVPATNAFAHRGYFAQTHDRTATSFATTALDRTEHNAIIIAPWVYATPLAYEAYVLHATAQREIVAGLAADLAGRLRGWIRARPVYGIAESDPAAPSVW